MNPELLHTELQQLRMKVQSQDKLLADMHALMQQVALQVSSKDFYSVEEFSQKTGLKPSTVKKYCIEGLLKATQASTGSKWMIECSEVERLRKQAEENLFNTRKSTTRADKRLLGIR
jgi:glucan phosphorylase